MKEQKLKKRKKEKMLEFIGAWRDSIWFFVAVCLCVGVPVLAAVIEDLRYPEGRCPSCKRGKLEKMNKKDPEELLFRCAACKKTFTEQQLAAEKKDDDEDMLSFDDYEKEKEVVAKNSES